MVSFGRLLSLVVMRVSGGGKDGSGRIWVPGCMLGFGLILFLLLPSLWLKILRLRLLMLWLSLILLMLSLDALFL